VIRVDARALFVRGRLVAQRHAPKVPAGDSPDPDPFDRVRGLDASMYRTYPESSLTLRALGRLSNPSEGPAFEPLISSGRGARVLWGGYRTLPRGQPLNP
jgi:hypothetical protein